MSMFTLFERPMAKALGLPVKILREKRAEHLEREKDWSLHQHCVAYSEAGFQLLILQLQLAQKKRGAAFALNCPLDLNTVKEAATVCPLKPPAAAMALPSTVTAIVVREAKNRRLLVCQLGKDQIYVQVKDRSKFPPGFAIPVRKKTDGSAWYELTCQEPRVRGRLIVATK